MQIRSNRYPLIALYELIRAVALLQRGAQTDGSLPVTWYAGIPLLALVPFAFVMLTFDEDGHKGWLPPLALAKAMCAVSLAAYAVLSFPEAVRFGSSGDISWFASTATAAIFCVADAVIGVYCFRRNRTLCK